MTAYEEAKTAFRALPREQQYDFIDEIIDDLDDHEIRPDLMSDAELLDRVEAHRADPGQCLSLAEVNAALLAELANDGVDSVG